MEKQLLKVYDEDENHVGYMVYIKNYVYIPKVDFDALSPITLYKKYGDTTLKINDTWLNGDQKLNALSLGE